MVSKFGGWICALVAIHAAACGGGEGEAPADVAGDSVDTVEDFTGRSIYRITVSQDDDVVSLDRDLTGDSNKFAFGSTHIAPAVSFAMTDSVTAPRTMTISLNFGIVVGSDALPVQTDGARTYAFTADPPAIEVAYRGLQYKSSLAGAAGSIVVTEWSVTSGEVVAGSFSGTLMAEGPSGRTLDVSGIFHFILPARQ